MRRIFILLAVFVFSFNAQADDYVLSAEQKVLAEKLRVYLNDMKTLKSGFAQISSNGAYADGKVVLQRPGKMHLVYNPPAQTEMIVRKGSIIYHDMEFKQVTYYPLNSTPLGVLLQEELSFEKDVRIVDLARGGGVVEMTLVDREDPGMGSVTLVFSEKPLALRKWAVVDAQGIMTQVSLLNPEVGVEIDSKHFEFVDPKYDSQNN